MEKKIIFATGNENKMKEIRMILADLGMPILSMKEAGIDALNVFIHADQIHRASRASELTGETNPNELRKMIIKKDKSRHHFYTHFASKHWGDSRNYTLSLDSGLLGYDTCVKLIVEAAKQ